MNAKHEEIIRVNELRAERDMLEREAEWLADRLKEACKSFSCLDCPFFNDDAAYCLYDEKPWREAAREALKEEDIDRRGFYQEGGRMLTEKKQKHLWAAVHRFKRRALKADGVERQKYLLRARRCLSALNFSFFGPDYFREARSWPMLSVRQPWAELILRGVKTCENRSFPLPERYARRHILLHASKQVDTLPETLRQYPGADVPCDGLPRGCIVGIVSFSPVNWKSAPEARVLLEPWASPDLYVWEIVAFWRFPVPIPARGALDSVVI